MPEQQYKPPFGLKWFHVKEVELLSIGTPCDEMLTLLSSVGITVSVTLRYFLAAILALEIVI